MPVSGGGRIDFLSDQLSVNYFFHFGKASLPCNAPDKTMALGNLFGSSWVALLLFLLLARKVATSCYTPDQIITNDAACTLESGDSFCCGPGLYVPASLGSNPLTSHALS